jgi:hypothetical protein
MTIRSRRPWPWPTARAQSQRADLLGQVEARGCGRPGRRPCRRRGTAERDANRDGRRRCPSACTSSCRCERLLARPLALWVPAWRLASCQRTMRARMSFARLETENLVRELDVTGVLAVEGGDLDVHYSAPSWFRPGLQRPRSAGRSPNRTSAGFGASRKRPS